MSLPRRVEQEWLDELSAEDPRAIRSRQDLRRINAVMLQSTVMARSLAKHFARKKPRTMLELGAGDGTFMLRLAQKLARRWPDVTVTMVDRQNLVSRETREHFRALGWQVETITADASGFLAEAKPASVDIVSANLFLHHFPDEQLAQLLALAAPLARLFVACEPRRGRWALLSTGLLWAIGCNDVSRHDARASVHAGFAGLEISRLWPSVGRWDLDERGVGPFTHCFVAHLAESGKQGEI
jgi:2-polyprenyl-3-methyl-5-hydroxy-6-metoxy-1,4-benzoquinol methylase